MNIEELELWFTKNDIENQPLYNTNLCQEICIYLTNKRNEISLQRSVHLKNNQKVTIPYMISYSFGNVTIEAPKQGNLKGLPAKIEGVLDVSNCGLFSLEGSVISVTKLLVSGNNLTSLNGLPDTNSLDVSLNPVKDFSLLRNRNFVELKLSLFELNKDELLLVLKDLLRSKVNEFMIKDSVMRSKHKIFHLEAREIQIEDSYVTYILSRKIIESIVLMQELEREIPIFKRASELVKF